MSPLLISVLIAFDVSFGTFLVDVRFIICNWLNRFCFRTFNSSVSIFSSNFCSFYWFRNRFLDWRFRFLNRCFVYRSFLQIFLQIFFLIDFIFLRGANVFFLFLCFLFRFLDLLLIFRSPGRLLPAMA